MMKLHKILIFRRKDTAAKICACCLLKASQFSRQPCSLTCVLYFSGAPALIIVV